MTQNGPLTVVFTVLMRIYSIILPACVLIHQLKCILNAFSALLGHNDVKLTVSPTLPDGPKIEKFNYHPKVVKLMDKVLLMNLVYKMANLRCYFGSIR